LTLTPGSCDSVDRRSSIVSRAPSSGGSFERLAQLTLHKLRLLGVPGYFDDGVIRGRLRVDPARLTPVGGVQFERLHPLFVSNLGKIAFASPSPLREIGELDILDLKNEEALLRRVEERWAIRAREIETALRLAATLAPSAALRPDRLTIEATISDAEGQAELRFSPDGAHAWVIGMNGARLEAKGLGANGSIRIDVVAERGVVLQQLVLARKEVRDLLAGEAKRDSWDRFVEIGELGEEGFAHPPDPNELIVEEPTVPTVEHRAQVPEPRRTPEPLRARPSLGPYDDPFQDYGEPMLAIGEPAPELSLPEGAEPAAEIDEPMLTIGEPTAEPDFGSHIEIDEPMLDLGLESLPPAPPPRAPPPVAHASPVAPPPVIQGTPIVDRRRRLEVDVPALIINGAHQSLGRIVNLNIGGAFISVKSDGFFEGADLKIETSGLPTIRARIVHVRKAEEAGRMRLPEGIGVAFLPEVQTRSQATIPHALVLMPDDSNRRSLSTSIATGGVLPIHAAHLIAACSSFLHHPVSMVLLDERFNGGDWQPAAEALGLDRLGAPVLILDRGEGPSTPAPAWAVRVHPEGLQRKMVQVLSPKPK
jgi:hypothetical protein